jgi:hypothetical protein
MKTIIFKAVLITLFSGIILTGNLFAAPNQDKQVKEIRKALKERVESRPVIFSDLQGTFDLTFTINTDRTINIKKANASSEEIKQYILDRLEGLNFESYTGPADKRYSIRITLLKS